MGFCLFLNCKNKNFCLSWSICYHCCFANFVLPTSNHSGKFWMSLPKSNSHSFEYIRTILWCRQIFSLQLNTQQKAARLRLWNTNKALKQCGKKNRPLLYQPNKRASVISFEKRGTQVCEKQSRWFLQWTIDPWNSLTRRTKRKNPPCCRMLAWAQGSQEAWERQTWRVTEHGPQLAQKIPYPENAQKVRDA